MSNDFDYYVARHPSTQEGRDTMSELQGVLSRIADEGRAVCRLCFFVATGSSYGEILQRLGEHGERAHPELVRQFTSANRAKVRHSAYRCSECGASVNAPGRCLCCSANG